MWKCPQCDQMVDDLRDACTVCGTTTQGMVNPYFVQQSTEHAHQTATLPTDESPQVCHRCGSCKVIPAVRILDHVTQIVTQDLHVSFERAPKAWLFKGSETSPLMAKICCGCGLVELFATDRDRLWQAYQERQ